MQIKQVPKYWSFLCTNLCLFLEKETSVSFGANGDGKWFSAPPPAQTFRAGMVPKMCDCLFLRSPRSERFTSLLDHTPCSAVRSLHVLQGYSLRSKPSPSTVWPCITCTFAESQAVSRHSLPTERCSNTRHVRMVCVGERQPRKGAIETPAILRPLTTFCTRTTRRSQTPVALGCRAKPSPATRVLGASDALNAPRRGALRTPTQCTSRDVRGARPRRCRAACGSTTSRDPTLSRLRARMAHMI